MHQEINSREDFYDENEILYIHTEQHIRDMIDLIFYESKNKSIPYERLEFRLIRKLKIEDIKELIRFEKIDQDEYKKRNSNIIGGIENLVYPIYLGVVYPRGIKQLELPY